MFRRIFLTALFLCATVRGGNGQDSGIDKSTFSPQVRIQDDFYMAVNGKWLNETEIPSDKSNYGAFTVLADLSQERIREIIETAAASKSAKGSDSQKVGDLYQSFMNVDRINEKGVRPVLAELVAIHELTTKAQLVKHWGHIDARGVMTPIGAYISPDAKNSTEYIISLLQYGTSLPDRDYYLEDDPKYLAAREALTKYIDTLFDLAKIEGSAAQSILALETKLAKVQWERTDLRDAEKRYNKFTQDELAKLTPSIDWSAFFESSEVKQPGDVILTAPSYFEGLDKLIAETPLGTWKQYLVFRTLDARAPYLSEAFDKAHFEFHSKALTGIPEQKPRWKRGVEVIEGSLGEVVGKLYVEKYFPPAAKSRMEELVANLVRAFDSSIGDLTWMTDVTKAKAKQKLSKFAVKIGYPNKWKDYSKLVIGPDIVQNVRRSSLVEHRRVVAKLGQPIDREEWGMTPQTVNAYYNPTKNEIVFPAAILQPPFFNMEADDAVNYGAIGAVIGHEISHGFDDQGSKYDGDGNLKSWWTAEDRQRFEAITKRLIEQFNAYTPLPGKTVNGQLTLGENIADLSGLAIAQKAYRISLDGDEPAEIDGWTGNQRFFLGWSQVWRRKYRDAEMMRRLLVDPHAPSWYRANGPVINIDAFYEAFNVKSSDAMFRPKSERIKLW